MSYVEHTVAEFGRSLGMNRLEFNDQGVVSLSSESWGALFIERADDGAIVYMVREAPYPAEEAYARALDACHWRHNRPYLPTPALRHDAQLAFAVRIGEREFDLPALERVISLLDQLHREVREGAPA